jgi:hypothetical protein
VRTDGKQTGVLVFIIHCETSGRGLIKRYEIKKVAAGPANRTHKKKRNKQKGATHCRSWCWDIAVAWRGAGAPGVRRPEGGVGVSVRPRLAA